MTTLQDIGSDQEILVPIGSQEKEELLRRFRMVHILNIRGVRHAVFTKERFHGTRHTLGLSDYELQQTDMEGLWLAVPKTVNHEARQRYMELSAPARISNQLHQAQKEVERLNEQIENHQQQLVNKIRQLQEKMRECAALEEAITDSSDTFGKEFDRLLERPDIREIDVSGTRITVHTNNITIDYGGTVYQIGEFSLVIHTDGTNGGIWMKNVTRKPGGYHHPHVNQSGSPCLGNIKKLIPRLIAEHKYGPLIDICIQFLKSYTRTDSEQPYHRIENWPAQQLQEGKTS